MKTTVAALLALGLFAQIAMAMQPENEELFQAWQGDHLSTVSQQRSLLQTGSTAAYSPRYSPSPAYSPRPSPSYSPSPAYSPRSPVAPKPCKFTGTPNTNTYTLVIRSTKNWGAGRNAIVKAAEIIYKAYSQPTYKYFVTVKGPAGQFPKRPVNDFIYTVTVPVTPCVGFKEGMRNRLRTAIKKVAAPHIKKVFFGIQA